MMKMNDTALVETLVQARMNGHRVDMAEPEGGLDRAQSLQLDVMRRMVADGKAVGGWKVGLTSGAAYDLMGKGVRPFGFILSDRTFPSGGACKWPTGLPLQIEPEICLEIQSPLRGRNLSVETCRAAVGAIRASFEINQMRVSMPGRNKAFVADGLSNWGLVVGTGRAPFVLSSVPIVRLSVDGAEARTSAADLVMDDPFLSLGRLCAALDVYGLGVDAGQYVIVGAFFRLGIERATTYKAEIEGVGEVSFTVT